MKQKLQIMSIILGILFTSVSSASTAAPLKVLTTADCGQSLLVNATLKADLECSEPIIINAPNISLNLNGFRLISTSDNNIEVTGSTGFSLSGGTILVAPGQKGIYSVGVSTLSVSKVKFIGEDEYGNTDSGIYVLNLAKVNISNSTFNNLAYGINGHESNINVSNSLFNKNGLGFYSFDDSTDVIQASNFSYNLTGVKAENPGNITINNSSSDNNQSRGIYLKGSVVVNITGTYARFNGSDGIYVDANYLLITGVSSSIVNTIASGNGAKGIRLSYTANMTVKGNVTNDNLNDGLRIEGNYGPYTIISASSNTALRNGNFGLFAQFAANGTGNKAYSNYLDCYGFVCTKNK